MATLGSQIVQRRKELGLSQRELAALILREEDGSPISPQYLNDIERDRRSPTSDHIIKQFAAALKDDADYYFYLAGTMPMELRALPRESAESAFRAFRRAIQK